MVHEITDGVSRGLIDSFRRFFRRFLEVPFLYCKIELCNFISLLHGPRNQGRAEDFVFWGTEVEAEPQHASPHPEPHP